MPTNLPELPDPNSLDALEQHMRQQITDLPAQYAPLVPIFALMAGLMFAILRLLIAMRFGGMTHTQWWQAIALMVSGAILGAILGLLASKYMLGLLP